ncbi:MAG TPA: pyruvate kinase [Negativicutes bacterium]|nr:pyruvate kinase [Negativicutes bacterium]
MKRTKIVCTVGPSTDNPGTLEAMFRAGMNVARFNFSHGNHEDHGKRMNQVREAAAAVGVPVAIMLDTKGPEIRMGTFVDKKVTLQAGASFTITTRDVPGTVEIVTVNYKGLPQEVAAGQIILLADGLLSLRIDKVDGTDILTTVENTGEISNFKRVAVPEVQLGLQFLSEQDVKDILFGVEQGIDFIAASFVQKTADVLAIRRVLEAKGADCHIIAKIENAAGVKNIDEILKVADGVMVARGDLGVEIPTEDVPIVQKMLIRRCNEVGKPVITATQMLESMMTNPRPTRAEATDVANAIMDGTDAIMLSGETASGKYPVEAVTMMATLAKRTEAALVYSEVMPSRSDSSAMITTTDAISHATVQVARELGAAAIITSTESGYTARMVSKYRPQAAIVAVTPKEKFVRRMLLLWGVMPVFVPQSSSTDEMMSNAIEGAMESGWVKTGDLVVITAGIPVGITGTTNMIRVHTVGQILLRGTGIGQRKATGEVCIAESLEDVANKFKPGQILVVRSLMDEMAPYAVKAMAVIAEEGGLTSQAAIIGVSFGIPVVVGVEGAMEKLSDGMMVTADTERGLIYKGEIHVR